MLYIQHFTNQDYLPDFFFFFSFFFQEKVNPFPNKYWFLHVCSTSLFKKTVEKEKLLATSNVSFSHSVFYSFAELYVIFIKFEIVVCKLFRSGRVCNLPFGKWLQNNRNVSITNFLIVYFYSVGQCTFTFLHK